MLKNGPEVRGRIIGDDGGFTAKTRRARRGNFGRGFGSGVWSGGFGVDGMGFSPDFDVLMTGS